MLTIVPSEPLSTFGVDINGVIKISVTIEDYIITAGTLSFLSKMAPLKVC